LGPADGHVPTDTDENDQPRDQAILEAWRAGMAFPLFEQIL
jgi:formiminotetrahydrofolate cyclodeaminase